MKNKKVKYGVLNTITNMSDQKTIDIIDQKPMKVKSGIYIGSDCVIPSLPLAQSFCDGFNNGINHSKIF